MKLVLVFLMFLFVALLAGPVRAGEPPVVESPLEALLATPISTAARYEQRLMDAPASVTVITAEEIQRYGFQTLAEALNSVRGLHVSDDRNYTSLGLRGFGRPADYNNRFLIMIDGHVMNENVFGSTAVGTDLAIDLSDVERIELVRGPGSVLYGSGAMLGVINVITNRGGSSDWTRAEVAVGSRGTRSAGLALGGSKGATDMKISAIARSSDGGDLFFPEYLQGGVSDGIARGLDDDHSYSMLGTVRRGNLGFEANLTHRRKGVPTGSYGTDFNERSETIDERRFIEITYDPRLDARTQIEVRAFWDSYHYSGEWAYEGYADSYSDVANGTFAGGEAHLLFDPRPNQRLTVGGRYVQNLRADYGSAGSPNAGRDSDVGSVFAQHEYQPAAGVTIVAGLRYDRQGSVSRTTPRLALLYQASSETALKLLYGEAFRLPTRWERFENLEQGYKANPDLRDESIRTLELVWEKRVSPTILAIFSAYEFRVEDLIEQRLDPQDDLYEFSNRGSVVSRGVEVELNRRLASGFWSFFNYSFQRAVEGGAWLTNSPRQLASAGASGPLSARLTGALELIYESGRLTMTNARTDPYLLANGTLAAKLGGGFRLVGQVRNALDVKYSLPGGLEHRQDVIEQNGRTFLLRLVYSHRESR